MLVEVKKHLKIIFNFVKFVLKYPLLSVKLYFFYRFHEKYSFLWLVFAAIHVIVAEFRIRTSKQTHQ